MTTHKKTRKSEVQIDDLQQPAEELTAEQARKVKGGRLAITSTQTGTRTNIAGQQLLASEIAVSK